MFQVIVRRTHLRLSRPLAAIAVLSIASSILVACGPASSDSEDTGDATERERVPATEFETLDGEAITLAELRGSVLVVNFWGTWCAPCRRELPELADLHRAYDGRGVEIVGIAVDSGDPDEIREFLAGYGVEYRIWITDMATALADFGSVGYPFTLVVDREGGVVSSFFGPQTLEALSAEIDVLLD